MSKLYFVATAHDEYRQRQFERGDVVVDPWRMVRDQDGVKVRRIGQNRPALISVLVPSRGRPKSFNRMYDSLMETVTYQRHVEIVAWIDEDDETYRSYPVAYPFRETRGEEIEQQSRIRYLRGPRQLLSSCWNDCYAASRGEILMHCGDDITFNTPGWDQRVREEFEKLPDRIGLVYGDDLSTNFPDLATHGFLHRRWVDTVGYFLPPLFSSDWNDVWISEVAKKVGRTVPIGDVVIEHHHYTFGKAERDQTHAEREERGIADGVVDLYKRTHMERENDAAKLRAVMV